MKRINKNGAYFPATCEGITVEPLLTDNTTNTGPFIQARQFCLSNNPTLASVVALPMRSLVLENSKNSAMLSGDASSGLQYLTCPLVCFSSRIKHVHNMGQVARSSTPTELHRPLPQHAYW